MSRYRVSIKKPSSLNIYVKKNQAYIAPISSSAMNKTGETWVSDSDHSEKTETLYNVDNLFKDMQVSDYSHGNNFTTIYLKDKNNVKYNASLETLFSIIKKYGILKNGIIPCDMYVAQVGSSIKFIGSGTDQDLEIMEGIKRTNTDPIEELKPGHIYEQLDGKQFIYIGYTDKAYDYEYSYKTNQKKLITNAKRHRYIDINKYSTDPFILTKNSFISADDYKKIISIKFKEKIDNNTKYNGYYNYNEFYSPISKDNLITLNDLNGLYIHCSKIKKKAIAEISKDFDINTFLNNYYNLDKMRQYHNVLYEVERTTQINFITSSQLAAHPGSKSNSQLKINLTKKEFVKKLNIVIDNLSPLMSLTSDLSQDPMEEFRKECYEFIEELSNYINFK